MIIVGIGSKARQGKDMAAEAILNYYLTHSQAMYKHGLRYVGPKVVKIGFADALYRECRELHGMTDKDAPLLQKVGHARRQEDPEYWIKKVFAAIPQGTDIVVIPDVRYKNEGDIIKAKGGYLIRMTRLNQDGTRYVAPDRPADHPSEIDLDDYNFDFEIVSKNPVLTGEIAITIVEYIRGLHV